MICMLRDMYLFDNNALISQDFIESFKEKIKESLLNFPKIKVKLLQKSSIWKGIVLWDSFSDFFVVVIQICLAYFYYSIHIQA